MKPLGRAYYKDKTGGKYKYKSDGIESNWWEGVCTPNKAREKRLAKKEIDESMEMGYTLIFIDDLED